MLTDLLDNGKKTGTPLIPKTWQELVILYPDLSGVSTASCIDNVSEIKWVRSVYDPTSRIFSLIAREKCLR